MANGLTNLIPDAYVALNVVSRELVGMIPAVMRDATLERAAVGQTVRSHVVPAQPATNITPGVTPPDDGDQTIGNLPLTLTKARRVPFRWQGEQQRGLENGGPGVLTIQQDQIAQAMRTLTNEIETDLCALHSTFSRAFGTPGTTPFASDLSSPAQTRKILDDNGAPPSDRHLIINTTAGASMRTLAQLTKANEAGDTSMLRQGVLLDIHGFAIRESAQVQSPTAGTGASYTTNTAGYAVGSTAITLITGTGTVLAGDVVTFAGDANKYLVAGALAAGVVTLAAPGLRVAIPTSAVAMTVLAGGTRNMAFRRSAIVLAQRLPALPDGGDLAIDRETITDPMSGLSFEIAMYPQYRQMQYEISCVWGVGNVKPEHTAVLYG
jgi:coat protein Gp5